MCTQVVKVERPYEGSGKSWEVPLEDNNYHRNLQNRGWRDTLKPLNIDQPEGPSFTVRDLFPVVICLVSRVPVTASHACGNLSSPNLSVKPKGGY